MFAARWATFVAWTVVLSACGSVAGGSSTTSASPSPSPLAFVLLKTDDPTLTVQDSDATDIVGTSDSGAFVTATGAGLSSSPSTADRAGRFSVHVSGLQLGTNQVTLTATLGGHRDNTLSMTIQRTLSEAAYKASVQNVSYPQLVKDPAALKGVIVHFQAQVFQYDSRTTTSHMIAAVTNSGYGFWSDNVWLDLSPSIAASITQKDVVEFWGTVVGPYTYQTSIGGSNTIPEINAAYMNLLQKGG